MPEVSTARLKVAVSWPSFALHSPARSLAAMGAPGGEGGEGGGPGPGEGNFLQGAAQPPGEKQEAQHGSLAFLLSFQYLAMTTAQGQHVVSTWPMTTEQGQRGAR